jgi:hypothetical protein
VLHVQRTHSEIAKGSGGLKGSSLSKGVGLRHGASGRDSEDLFVVNFVTYLNFFMVSVLDQLLRLRLVGRPKAE